MLFATLFRKAYLVQLQYRGAHAIRSVTSVIFGYIYISIWIGLGADHSLGKYGTEGMIAYIAANQAILVTTLFITYGLGIETLVRSGNIAVDLLRPVHLFPHLAWKEAGKIVYSFMYRAIPIYAFFALVFSIPLPSRPEAWAAAACSLVMASYINICINYMIGAASLWSGEARFLYWLHYAVAMVISGFFLPIEWLPAPLRAAAVWTPYPYIQYAPVTLFLGTNERPLAALLGALAWCAALTALCYAVTAVVRRKLEVQGG
ncbi:ABC transporter permease [Paenibacillus sp.]|uniref:ABC transporter permease n=1 Tax=Paenibacillus sp. TaxID=58172 RepID=UPI002D3C32CA|nr:ABC-2 family transporter protein [Paenibacillus sp.]HZG85768.1 ABC-2 family transporter protein [Paenibacillus sp.]